MSELKNCSLCQSADGVLHDFISSLSVETSHHRMEKQKIKCGFGLQGVCCRLCANGPCRITPAAPRGVCGATADTIVARNFLRAVAAGSGCYIHIVENAAHNLKALGMNKEELKGLKTLDELAEILGIEESDVHRKAVLVGNKIIADLYKPGFEKMELAGKLGFSPRVQKWKELNLMPGGAKSEVFDGIVKTSTNLNSDPVEMLFHSLRLGISTGLYGLMLTNMLNDIIMGEPVIRTASAGLRVIDPDYINIMLTGHQQSMFSSLQKELLDEKNTAKSVACGAKGFKLIGCTCVGQDFQLRAEHSCEVFSGHAGNNFTSEAVMATGAIDLVVSEFNCTLPGIEPIADEMMIKMICIDPVAKKANARQIAYDFSDPGDSARYIVDEAVNSYRVRRPKITIQQPTHHGADNVLTGIGEKSLKQFLGNTWEPLINLIAENKIKGLAAVVGCSNLTAGGHDVFTVALTRELIKRDILVLSAGCTSGGLENAGLMSPDAAAFAGSSLKTVCENLGIPPVLNFGPCLAIGRLEMVAVGLAESLGIDLPQLPLVLSAPQWLEEQALADGAFGLALGLPLHLAKPPFITGSKLVTNILTGEMKKLTGGQLILDDDVVSTAGKLEQIILEKREALGLKNQVEMCV